MSITSEPATRGSKSRRPLEFWSPLNRWWREYFSEHQRRPGTRDIDAWYADHADEAWPTDHKPTLKEARLHANCLRPVDEVKKYFRAYRKRKAGPSSPADDDTEGHAAEELAVHACKQPRATAPEPQQTRPAARHLPQMADQNATQAELPSFHSMDVLRAIPRNDPHPCLSAALLRAAALPLHTSCHTGFPKEQPAAAAHSHSCTSLSTHSGLGNASSLSEGPLVKDEEEAAPTPVAAAATAPLPRHSSSAGSSACTANAIGQNHTSRQLDAGIASYCHGHAPACRDPCVPMASLGDAALGARVSASGQDSPVPGQGVLEGLKGALGAAHRAGLHGLPTCPDQGRGAAEGALARALLQQGIGGVRGADGEALLGGRGGCTLQPEDCGGQQVWGLLDRALKQEPGLLASTAWHASVSELQGLGSAVPVHSLQLLGHGRGQGGQVQVYVDGVGRVLQGDGDALTLLGQAPGDTLVHPGSGPHGVASRAPKGGHHSLGMQQGPQLRRAPGAPPSHLPSPASRRASGTDAGERSAVAPPALMHPSASDGPSLVLAKGLPTRLSLAGSETSRGLAPVHSTARHSEPDPECGTFPGFGMGAGLLGQASPRHGGASGAAQLSERTLTSISAHVHIPPHLKSQLLARTAHSSHPESRAGDVSPCSSDVAPPAWSSSANLPTASAHGGLRVDNRAAQQQLPLSLMLSGGATPQHALQAYGLHQLPAALRTGLDLAGLLVAQNDGLGGISASAHGLSAMLAPSPSLAPTTAMVWRVLTPEGLSAPVLLACPMQGSAGLMMGTQFMPQRPHHGSTAGAMLVHTL